MHSPGHDEDWHGQFRISKIAEWTGGSAQAYENNMTRKMTKILLWGPDLDPKAQRVIKI